jgi:hypothetical protein
MGDRQLVAILWSLHILEDLDLSELYIQTQFLPRRQQIRLSVVETNGLTLLRIIMAVCLDVTSYVSTLNEHN